MAPGDKLTFYSKNETEIIVEKFNEGFTTYSQVDNVQIHCDFQEALKTVWKNKPIEFV